MNIFVGNLAFEATPEELKKTFEEFGKVSIVKIMLNDKGTKSRGFAFLEMPDELEARKAIGALNGREFIGRPLVVGVARPKLETVREKPKVKRQRNNFRVEANREASRRQPHPGYGEGGGYRGGKRMRGAARSNADENQDAPRRETYFKPWSRPFEDRRPADNRGGGSHSEGTRGNFQKPWERTAPASGKPPFRPARRESRPPFAAPVRDDRRGKPWSKPAGERPARAWRGNEERSGRPPQRPWKKREEGAAPFRRSEHPGAARQERGRFVKPWERTAPASGKPPFRPARRESRPPFAAPARDDRRGKPWSKPAGERPARAWRGNEERSGRPPQRPWKKREEGAAPFRRSEHPGAGRQERGRFVKPWERTAPASGKPPFRPARRESRPPFAASARDDRRGKPWSKPAGERPARPWRGGEGKPEGSRVRGHSNSFKPWSKPSGADKPRGSGERRPWQKSPRREGPARSHTRRP